MQQAVLQDALAAGARHLATVDPVLARIIERLGPLRFEPDDRHLRTLVSSVVSQQLSGKAAASIMGRLTVLFDTEGEVRPEHILNVPVEALRGAGLSARKVECLRDLASAVRGGAIALYRFAELTDEEVIVQLTQVKGIGRWTAEMYLLFTLGRLNVLPVGDLGFRSSVRRHYGLEQLPSKAEIERIAAPWHPYCSIATHYLWQAHDGVAAMP